MLRSGIYSFAFVKLSARTGSGGTPTRWYFFALAIINVTEIATAHNSATGNADHTPFMPINIGKISIAAHSKTSVLATEITAEILPLLSAVKSPDAKIFIPHNR